MKGQIFFGILCIFLARNSNGASNFSISASSSFFAFDNVNGGNETSCGYSATLGPDGLIHYVKMDNGQIENGTLNGTIPADHFREFFQDWFPIVLDTYSSSSENLKLSDAITNSVDRYLARMGLLEDDK